jgi:hypothetical protein
MYVHVSPASSEFVLEFKTSTKINWLQAYMYSLFPLKLLNGCTEQLWLTIRACLHYLGKLDQCHIFTCSSEGPSALFGTKCSTLSALLGAHNQTNVSNGKGFCHHGRMLWWLIVVLSLTIVYFVCVLSLLLLVLVDLVASSSNDEVADLEEYRVISKTRQYVATAVMVVATIRGLLDSDDESSDGEGAQSRTRGIRDKARNRVRRDVSSIFREQGPYYVRRAYRMTESSFWELHRILQPYMSSIRLKGGRQKNHRNGGKNGLISSETRLSAAIRYFAGGRPEDIAICHGIAHSEVFYSVWKVVDAVNRCEELAFGFPASHAKQQELALAFKAKSAAGIDCCVGAVDGMLLWIERPTNADCERAHCGSKKFFCGRKHKFGLNLQATCDAEGKFLDVSIAHPASTSDFLAFSTSSLQKKIETPGYLAPGLCIFGDAAYVNNGYFMTPFKNVKGGIKDTFNFYHSQLRINIECAFGMFVGRWGC